MWFLHELMPESIAYNGVFGYRLIGRLDLPALQTALDLVIRRHDSMRTTFRMEERTLQQVVAEHQLVDLEVIDRRGLPHPERALEAERTARSELAKAFDLARGPLFRFKLLTLGDDESILFLSTHHIAFDGWSLEVFFRDLAALYDDTSRGRAPSLPPLALQYTTFAEEQRQMLSADNRRRLLGYWTTHLEGAAALELPADRPRPPVQTYRGGCIILDVPSELMAGLKALAAKEGATSFTALAAAFNLILARYARSRDISVGMPVANRSRPELEHVIGCFINMVVLRTHLLGEPTFREVIRRLQREVLGALEHQELPFELLVDELHPERDMGRSPLFQVMIHQDVPRPSFQAGGLRFEYFPFEPDEVHYDLVLTVGEAGREQIVLGYSADLFERSTVERMARHYLLLLHDALARPDVPASTLSPLLPSDAELIARTNATRGPPPSVELVHQFFEAQAKRTPEREALVFGASRLDYREVGARANRLAHHLIRMGVGPDVPVGIAAHRNHDAAVAVLAVLKAGAAYVPCNPSEPPDRLRYMLDNARAKHVLAHADLVQKLELRAPILLDAPGGWSSEPEHDPEPRAHADDLAYVIYTSGSTGKPKGVALSHGALVNLIDWHVATLLGGARVAQFAPLAFDASFHELFAAWATGGTVFVLGEEERLDMPQLTASLATHRIEKFITPVVVLQQLAESLHGEESKLASMREVIATGEQLQITRPIVELFEKLPRTSLINHYGPSESHVVTAYTLPTDPRTWPTFPSIGSPIANTEIHILDEAMRAVPIGAIGELYIGGRNLARGYLHRPDLTAERFVPDPVGPDRGARLYRSGDLARRTAHGELEYLGRIDRQVKIRGFRVELGEVESVLLDQPSVAEAVVVPWDQAVGDRRLCAYVVPATGAGRDLEGTLRPALRVRLPAHMIPSSIVVLESLPLTSNGKVDRRALPAPEQERAGRLDPQDAPRTPVEESLAHLCAELLGVDEVGVHESFFDLGGHSLLLTQLASRIRESFEVTIPLWRLFEKPTVEGMTEAIAETMLAEEGEVAIQEMLGIEP
jgi:amino acid adenylation domain-containing protein